MTQHQQLQKKINGIIQPDADKLLVQGCELVHKDNKELFLIDNYSFSYNNGLIFLYGKPLDLNQFEILGQKLNLEAVLMATEDIGGYSIKESVCLSEIILGIGCKKFKYHLLLPPDQQPIETQKALFEIFGV